MKNTTTFALLIALVAGFWPRSASGRADREHRETDQDEVAPEEQTDADEEEPEEHDGFFSRMTLGAGGGWIAGQGMLNPLPGLERTVDPVHTSLALNLSADFGGAIIDDLALHAGFSIERMVTRAEHPTMGFTLIGIGAGMSFYFTEEDLFVTAQARYATMLLYLPDVSCENFFADKYEWYSGPAFALLFGKEWYRGKERGVGLALEGNFAYLSGDDVTFNYYSLILAFTFTRF